MKFLLVNRVLMLLSAAGLFVAGMLTYTHYAGKNIPCGTNGGCAALALRPESLWFGQPVALYGLLGYAAIFALAFMRTRAPGERQNSLAMAGFGISLFGTLTSAYLMYTLYVVLDLHCPWCMASAALMITLLIGHAVLYNTRDHAAPGQVFDAIAGPALAVIAIAGVGMYGISINETAQRVTNIGAGQFDIARVVPSAAYFKGPVDAPITVIEFADFYCPACRQSAKLLDQAMAIYPGRVRVAYRNLPLFQKEGHEMSLPAAVAQEIAAKHGKFWEFKDAVFSEKYAVVRDPLVYVDLLEDLGVPRAQAEREIGNTEGAAFKAVTQSVEEATRLNLPGTPSFIVIAPGLEPKIVAAPRLLSLLQEPEYQKAADAGAIL